MNGVLTELFEYFMDNSSVFYVVNFWLILCPSYSIKWSIAPAPLDHLGNERRPARVMACPEALPGIAVVILIEVYKVLEIGVLLVHSVFTMHEPSALVIFCKDGGHSLSEFYGNLLEVHAVP